MPLFLYRNTEKRKEKSRDAARCRRSKEAEIFADINSQLPVSQQAADQLDKTSIMRLAIAHLKLRTLFSKGTSTLVIYYIICNQSII